ncbi:MAG: PIN domain-containing protein [Clostridiaceae bacterium]|jgi:predicted nucleic acid-binding protein|nr:PIN domain-containing protein [Clostridiaceae bacterium]
MKVLVDTHVVLDVILRREPHFTASYEILNLAVQDKLHVMITTSCVTDIYYLLRKSGMDDSTSRNALSQLFILSKLADVRADDIQCALSSRVTDFEDAVIAEVARRNACHSIITRNTKDFVVSEIPAIEPVKFLETYKPD